MSFSNPQRSVALGMAAGLSITIAALGLTALLEPFGALAGALPARLQLLALSALAPAVALAVCIARLAAHRFHTPEDLDGSGLTAGTAQARLLQALLQNTLEQLALAIPVYTAWTLLAPAHLLAVVLTAAFLFIIGRVLFFWGYARGAPGRALGFTLTFYPTVGVLAGVLILAARALGQ
jgi:hypothetical protein